MSIVEMSVQAGMLIIAVVIVRAIALYRLPKTSFFALWGIVVARMLIPFSVTSKWSVYNLFASVQSPAGGSVPVEPPAAAWGDPVQLPGLVLPGDAGAPSTALAAVSLSPLEALWLVGMAVLVALFVLMLARNYWALRNAVPVTGNAFITEWRGKYRLARPLEIVQSDRVTSPASLGILRPRIVFPQQMDMDDGRLIRYILVHEYFHIRRFDMLWKLLALCAVCVHWFNPLAWVMLFLLNRDLELSCDEMVLRHFGGTDRAAYAHSLIDMAERNRAFSIASYFSKNAVEERIIAVMKYKKSSLLALALVLALAVGMTTAFATSATAKENQVAEIGTVTDSLFGTLNDIDKVDTVPTDIAQIQMDTENLFGKNDDDITASSEEGLATPIMGVMSSTENSKKTSFAAQSEISYTFGSGNNQTFYEKDTEIEFTIQCAYADIPLVINLVSADSAEVVDSQRVESSEQTTIVLTVPADGDYLISVKNESLSRTQEYNHIISR